MKKALALVALIVTPTMASAQGTVVFENQTGLVQQWTSTYDWTPTPVPVGGGYVQLISTFKGNALNNPFGGYAGSSGFVPGYSSLVGFLVANPGWAAQAPVPISDAPGIFSGGIVTIFPTDAGGEADYVVIGWTGPYATYDAAFAANLNTPNSSFLGISAIATTATGDVFHTPPGTPVSLSPTFAGITLAPYLIPEPSTFALAGLGAVMLMLLHRRMVLGAIDPRVQSSWTAPCRFERCEVWHWACNGRAGTHSRITGDKASISSVVTGRLGPAPEHSRGTGPRHVSEPGLRAGHNSANPRRPVGRLC